LINQKSRFARRSNDRASSMLRFAQRSEDREPSAFASLSSQMFANWKIKLKFDYLLVCLCTQTMIIIKWIYTKWIWQYYLIYVIYMDFIIILIILLTYFIFTIVYAANLGHDVTNSKNTNPKVIKDLKPF
jgi:hypothetical protein